MALERSEEGQGVLDTIKGLEMGGSCGVPDLPAAPAAPKKAGAKKKAAAKKKR